MSDTLSDIDAEALRRKAERGDAEARNVLGVHLMTGDGVERDPAEAVRWWRKAAEQGHADAAAALARLGAEERFHSGSAS